MDPLLMSNIIEIIEEDPEAAQRFILEYYAITKAEKHDTPYFLQGRLTHQKDMSYLLAWFKNIDFSQANRKFIRRLANSNAFLRKDIAKHPDKWLPFIREISFCEKPELDRLSMNLWIMKSEFEIDEVEFSNQINPLETSIIFDKNSRPRYWDKIYSDGVIRDIKGTVSAATEETSYACQLSLDRASYAFCTRHSNDSVAVVRDKRFLYLTGFEFNPSDFDIHANSNPEFEFVDDIKGALDEHISETERGKVKSFSLSTILPSINGQNPSYLYKS